MAVMCGWRAFVVDACLSVPRLTFHFCTYARTLRAIYLPQ